MIASLEPACRPRTPSLEGALFDRAAIANELEASLGCIAGNERELRLAVSRHLKRALGQGRAAAEQLLIKDRLGRRCAERLSDMQDEIIGVAVRPSRAGTSIPRRIPRKPSAWRSSRPAAMAAACWRRAPTSICCSCSRTSRPPGASRVAEAILYCLWDMGLKVGHATRSVDRMHPAGEEPT